MKRKPSFQSTALLDERCFESVAHSNEDVKHIDKEKWARALGVESMGMYPERYAARVTARVTARVVFPAPAGWNAARNIQNSGSTCLHLC